MKYDVKSAVKLMNGPNSGSDVTGSAEAPVGCVVASVVCVTVDTAVVGGGASTCRCTTMVCDVVVYGAV